MPDLLISAANQNSCPAGYTIVENSMIKTGESNSQTQVAGGLSLAAYIKQRLNDFVGETFYTFNAFVTPPNSGSTASATSAGTAYQALVDDLGKGKTTDIRADSYEAALENLGSVLRNQLIRSIQFQKVTGTQKVHRVWKRSDSQSEWGEPLDKTLWTSSGGTVTLNSTLELGVDDELQIEFY